MSKREVFRSVSRFSLCLGAVFNLAGVASLVPLPAVAAEGDATITKKSVARPHMDLAFCIDTTSSMQSEIDMVKKKTKSLVAQLAAGKPAPIVRVGVVAYRDLGDAYVTKVFPFTDDIDKVVKDISDLQAQGGGDGPEAVDRGLHSAIKDLKWSSDKHTAKILFVIGDAGPHGAKTDVDWRSDCRGAIASGIQINTIGCAGLENYPAVSGVDIFKQIAHLADGKFESLAYRQEVVDGSGNKTAFVNSGGKMFEVPRASTAGDAWKKEIAAGNAKAIAPSAIYLQSASPESLGGGMAVNRAGLASAGVPMSAPMAAFSAASSSVSNRADNNLDDIMLRDARKRANSVVK